MIDDRQQEQAALYAAGALSETEQQEFLREMDGSAELKDFVLDLSSAVDAIAGAVPARKPPAELRARILERVGGGREVVPLPAAKAASFNWWPWALAACLAMVCVILLSQEGQLRKTIGGQAARIDELNQLAQSLQSATNDLERSVAALRETNRLANLRIAMLNSLVAKLPKAAAVSLWDEGRQEGVFVGENLKPLPSNQDYQLWVLDNGKTPVDAGVFHVDDQGRVHIPFKTRLRIKVAGRFAVTEEIRGGSPSPTLKNMVLASN